MNQQTIPEFDCLAYKWKVQAEIYEKIKDMSPEEEEAFFRHAAETGPFAELVRELCDRKGRTSLTSPTGPNR